MTPPAEHGTPRSPRRSTTRDRLWIAGAALAGLVVGAVIALAWQSPRASSLRHSAEYASRALHAARLEATLAAAVIAATDGRYELGRQHASAFFTGLQRSPAPTTSNQAGDAIRQLQSRRDQIITALARNDPASRTMLAETLTRYRELIRQAGLDSTVGPRPPPR